MGVGGCQAVSKGVKMYKGVSGRIIVMEEVGTNKKFGMRVKKSAFIRSMRFYQ